MMLWLSVIFLVAVYGGGGVTKTSGIAKFWADDSKVFEQVYGKTSDKDLYGATLPPNFAFGIDAENFKKDATEKKERIIQKDDDATGLDSQLEPYRFSDSYINLLAKQPLKSIDNAKPTKSPFKFITSADFKPISQDSDPETYNYLKHLELLGKKNNVEFHRDTVGEFKPYVSYSGTSPEETDAYQSIQDILDAHEANKVREKQNIDEDEVAEYITYGSTNSRKKKPNARLPNKKKHRCVSGRCRKRIGNPVRVYTRPYLRRIKHRIVSN